MGKDRNITRFRGVFPSGLDKETVNGELVSCVISETGSIKRDWILVWYILVN